MPKFGIEKSSFYLTWMLIVNQLLNKETKVHRNTNSKFKSLNSQGLHEINNKKHIK